MPGHYEAYQQAISSAPLTQTGQSGGPAGMTFTESVSNPNIGVTQQEAQQQQQQFQTGDFSSKDTDPKPKDEKKSKEEEEKKEDGVLEKLLTANEIKRLDANQLARAQQIINQFRPLNLSPLQARNYLIATLFRGLTGKDQTYTDFEGNLIDPDKVDIISGAAGMPTLVGPKGVDVRLSREGILDQLGKDTYASLERFYPDLIYGTDIGVTPATTGGLVDLANTRGATKVVGKDGKISYLTADGRTISKEQGERFNDAILNARDELNRMDRNPFTGTKNSPADSPAFASPTTPQQPINVTFPAQPPVYPGFPGVPPLPGPGLPTPPGTPTTPAVTSYSNMPTYTQSGIPTFLGDPRFAQFRDALNLFPRV